MEEIKEVNRRDVYVLGAKKVKEAPSRVREGACRTRRGEAGGHGCMLGSGGHRGLRG